MPTTIRKRRTRAHVIADLSVNHVEKQVLLCGWTVQRLIPDYGIDLSMNTFNRRGEVENGQVRFQVKATDSIKIIRGRSVISVRVEWRDMIFWLNQEMPMILVVYDARTDRAWWIHVNEAVRQEGRRAGVLRATLTLHVPLENILTTEAVRGFRGLRDSALA